jgi:hypothetical protein
MQLKTKLVAAIVGSLFATSAFAQGDDADIYNSTRHTNTSTAMGLVWYGGYLTVDGHSSATVDQDQLTLLNWIFGDGDMSASAEDGAARHARGNIGINIAAGTGNAQANDAAIASVDTKDAAASAMLFNSQLSGVNVGTDFPSGPDSQLFYDALVTDDVLRHASGNIGLNVAAGTGNAQSNALVASVNSSNSVAHASADSEQSSVFNVLFVLRDLDATATLNGNALEHAVGNIGVNIAAGAGNLQHNGLAISTGN